ncbi:MAG: outer membrane lipoprotein carrier protein LolA [Desulfatitalea sp.]
MATARSLLVFTAMVATLWVAPLFSQTAGGQAVTLDQILDGIERRYDGKGFAAAFFQESILKAMQITDTAEGRLTVKRPGKMRWEYTIPEAQSIITDGRSMWIYRPADNQVMVGKAPEYFGGGKGAGFLSDIRQLRKSFTIQMQAAENKDYYRLKLVPVKPTPELADIVISAAKSTFQIDQVVTHNSYGDETRIVLSDYKFDIDPSDGLFNFAIPKGADVVKMDKF